MLIFVFGTSWLRIVASLVIAFVTAALFRHAHPHASVLAQVAVSSAATLGLNGFWNFARAAARGEDKSDD